MLKGLENIRVSEVELRHELHTPYAARRRTMHSSIVSGFADMRINEMSF